MVKLWFFQVYLFKYTMFVHRAVHSELLMRTSRKRSIEETRLVEIHNYMTTKL